MILDADVRRGRDAEQKRAFALAVMELTAETWAISDSNMKIVFIEHAGENMMSMDRVGDE